MDTRNTASRIHSTCSLAAVAGLLVLSSTQAHALKESIELTPANLQYSGFALKVRERKDGTIEFTVIRDLANARTFAPDSGLIVRRSASLRVFGKSGLLVECDLEPDAQQKSVSYRFRIERAHVRDSHLSVAEIDDYKDQSRERLLGGGTFYEFHLGLFATQFSSPPKSTKELDAGSVR